MFDVYVYILRVYMHDCVYACTCVYMCSLYMYMYFDVYPLRRVYTVPLLVQLAACGWRQGGACIPACINLVRAVRRT